MCFKHILSVVLHIIKNFVLNAQLLSLLLLLSAAIVVLQKSLDDGQESGEEKAFQCNLKPCAIQMLGQQKHSDVRKKNEKS